VRYSVVVPTRDRPESLERCLAAVVEAAPEAEIVVVDDGSMDASAVAAAARRHAAVLVRTERVGAAAARNAGARRASGEIVLLTDDDCLPAPDWAEVLSASVARSPGLAVVGGRTEPSPGSVFVRASQSVIGTVERAAPFCATSNVGCRRQTVLEVPFDESFREASGEDRDWCARVLRAGGEIVREPRAVVVHVPAVGARAFWRRHVRYGRSGRRLRQGSLPARVRLGARVVRDGFASGPTVGALVVVAQVATLVGYVAGPASCVSGGR